MIAVVELQKHFGGHTVLDAVSFAVRPGERVALVGANGCGKTTLLRILAGTESSDGGHIARPNHLSFGYLGQEGQLTPGRTLHEEMRDVFRDAHTWEARLRELESDFSTYEGEELQTLLEEYGALQARYDHADPMTIDARIGKVLGGLGFQTKDFNKLCELFSGGWQMRGAMARVLLQAPDCLLLDEPTNHLDLEAMEWLENYLLSYRGAVLMVSHDRTFLDKVSARTLELRHGDLEEYAGNYSYYLDESKQRAELRLQRYKNQQKKLEQEQRFIERFRYKASLASRVKSREKLIAKRVLEAPPDAKTKGTRMAFHQAESSGLQILEVKNLTKSYGPHGIFSGLTFNVERGDRVAIVGPNGCGKTTLLKILSGFEFADEGRFRFDEFARVVAFAQHQAESLDMTRSILEEVESVAPAHTTQTEVRTLLGCFLFSGSDVHKKIAVLSGGEKARVALTKCVLSSSNVLILDEPTNHLDIESRQALQDALTLYEGTILFVTHDRTLMGHLATKILNLSHTHPTVFTGSYQAFREQEKRRAQTSSSTPSSTRKPPSPQASKPTQKPVPAHRRATPWKLDALEKKIFSLEAELEGLTQELANPELYANALRQQQIQTKYEVTEKQCRELTQLWEEMTEAG